MTPTRRRVRMSKYIILVNHIGTKMGTKFLYLYFIDIKQLLNSIKQSLTRIKAPRSHKPMMRRFGTTP